MSMAPTSACLLPFLLLTLVTLSPVRAALTNITIDDADSSHFTWGEATDSPAPTLPWAAITPSTPCLYCSAQPQTADILDQTWHDGSNNSAGSFTFQGALFFSLHFRAHFGFFCGSDWDLRAGSAVYIYGIDLANPANISFAMDDGTTAFHYYSGSAQFVFKSLFFSASNLPAGVNHTVSWVLHATQMNGSAGLFDYAVVTVDASTVSSSSATQSPTGTTAPSTQAKHKSTTGPIVGGVVGGLALIALIALALALLARRRRKNAPAADVRPFVVAGGTNDNINGRTSEKMLDVSWTNPQPPTLTAATTTATHPSTTDLSASATTPSAPSATSGERAPTDVTSTHAQSLPSSTTNASAPSTHAQSLTTERERVLEDRLALLEAQVGQHLVQPPPYGAADA
ncbi:hypothetical protein C8R44DRAFT_889434 [Mycena epipterygia]|nr:hypothetical protein C8R44DRAFT_889434 [Mycena epipterygia]